MSRIEVIEGRVAVSGADRSRLLRPGFGTRVARGSAQGLFGVTPDLTTLGKVVGGGLPIGVLAAFVVMHLQGLNANIMSLSGIAIAIGAMVDAAIVMIENMHKHLERGDVARHGHWQAVIDASREVGPALFFSLLIITVSFLPVFTLEAQEGRLFRPLAYTKTWAMAAAAGLSITLVPALMAYLIRGRIRHERDNPLNRWLIAAYRPLIERVLKHYVRAKGLGPLDPEERRWRRRERRGRSRCCCRT